MSPDRRRTATCPRCWCRSKSGATRVTGLDDRETDQTFETEFTARSNPHRGYITIIEGCDKFCAYCVVPYTRGKERSRTSQSVLDEARRMADAGYTDIQLLGQNVNSYRDPAGKMTFAELLAAVGELTGIRRVRFTTSHPRDFTKDIIDAIDAVPALCDHVHLPVQSGSSRVLESMFREYTREQYLERIAWMKASAQQGDQHHHRRDRRIPGRDRSRVRRDAEPAGRGRLRWRVFVQILAAAEYPGAAIHRLDSRGGEIAPPPDPAGASAGASKRSAIKRHLGQILEVMVEGTNTARGQMIGRTSQNKTLNFTISGACRAASSEITCKFEVTQTFPNSLLGTMVE